MNLAPCERRRRRQTPRCTVSSARDLRHPHITEQVLVALIARARTAKDHHRRHVVRPLMRRPRRATDPNRGRVVAAGWRSHLCKQSIPYSHARGDLDEAGGIESVTGGGRPPTKEAKLLWRHRAERGTREPWRCVHRRRVVCLSTHSSQWPHRLPFGGSSASQERANLVGKCGRAYLLADDGHTLTHSLDQCSV